MTILRSTFQWLVHHCTVLLMHVLTKPLSHVLARFGEWPCNVLNMQYPCVERRQADSPMVRHRKISMSVDEGLNRLLSNRPLPEIPSEDSDVDESESIYEEPRSDTMEALEPMDGNVNATSAVRPRDAIYDILRPGVRPAAKEHHGKFKTKTQLKAWSQSELGAEPSADKDSGSEEEQDLKSPTTEEDKLEDSATDDYKEKETRATVQFSQHEHN